VSSKPTTKEAEVNRVFITNMLALAIKLQQAEMESKMGLESVCAFEIADAITQCAKATREHNKGAVAESYWELIDANNKWLAKRWPGYGEPSD